MKQALLLEPGKFIYQEVAKPTPLDDEVLIEVKRIGICGSDVHTYHGTHPFVNCPVVLGHEFSGVVTEKGENVGEFEIGDIVTAMPQLVCGECLNCKNGRYNICKSLKLIGCASGTDGAAQEYVSVSKHSVLKLPEKISLDVGAMIEPAAVGVHAVRRLGDVTGKNILVLGAGAIGNLTAQAAKALGASRVMITDISDFRLKLALACGLDSAVNTATEDLSTRLLEAFGEDGADAIVECVGTQATIMQAIDCSRKGIDIVIAGICGKIPQVDMAKVQDKELRLIGSLIYTKQDFSAALDFAATEKMRLLPILTTHFAFEQIPDAFAFIEQHRESAMKIIIDM